MLTPRMSVTLRGHELNFTFAKAFFDDLEERSFDFDGLPRRVIEEYQIKQLTEIVDFARRHNDYYRMKLGKYFKGRGFSEIPFLQKATIQGDKERLLSCPIDDLGQIHLTSGTTGEPTYVAYSLADQYLYDLLPQYSSLYPYGSKDIVGIALPYEFALPALGFQRLFQFVFGATCLSLGKGGYMAPIDKVLKLLETYKPTVIATTPSYAALLYEEAERSGYRIDAFGIKSFILTGEGCSFNFRRRLEELWQADMTFLYGSTELGLIAKECSKAKHYHLCEGHVFAEIVDEAGNQLPDGEVGELVVTTLLREAMPMIRYKTGDQAIISEEACSCGCQMKQLVLMGRKTDQIQTPVGALSPFVIENVMMKSDHISLWYRIYVTDKGIEIHCENVSGVSDDNLREEIKYLFFEELDMICEVKIVEHIERQYGKNKRVFRKGEQ